ncbi:hypothetical protein ACF0H5_014364 [Mactra antiquata]
MSLITRILLLGVTIGFVQSLKPCCISKIYFAKMKIERGDVKPNSNQTVITDNKLEFEYDADLQFERVAGSIFSTQDMQSHGYLVYNDYKNGRSYTKYDMDPSCHVKAINPDDLSPHCVPPTLTWAGEYTVGSGMEDMRINSWYGQYNDFMYSMQTTVNDCTPVSMTRFGTEEDGTRVVESILYVNVTQYSHSRPDIFTLPPECANMMPNPVGK